MKETELSWFRAAGAAAFPATVLAIPVLELYLKNRNEFALSLGAMCRMAGGLFCGILIVLATLYWTLRRWRGISALMAVFTGLAMTVLLQQEAWANVFPELPQEELSRTLQRLFGVLNLLLLAIPVLLAWFFRQSLQRYCGRIGLALALALAAAPAQTLLGQLRTPPSAVARDYQDYTLDTSGEFVFASRQNILVIVVDCMGEYLFKTALAQAPDLREAFRDFTAFDRMISPIPRTQWAVPALLSGQLCEGNPLEDENIDHDQYLERAFHAPGSVFLEAKAAGWRTEGYPYILQTIPYDPELLDNVIPITDEAQHASGQMLVRIALARLCPTFLRLPLGLNDLLGERVFAPPAAFTEKTDAPDPNLTDVTFRDRMNAEIRIGGFDKCLKYMHLQGAHQQVHLDENLNVTSQTNKVRQQIGSLRVVAQLLKHLQELGLYDQALIVIAGDHSERYTSENIAIFKNPGGHQTALVYDSIPCRISDLAATIDREGGLAPEAPSLFDLPAILGDGEFRAEAIPAAVAARTWHSALNALPESLQSTFHNYFEFLNGASSPIIQCGADDETAIEQAQICFRLEGVDCQVAWESDPLEMPEELSKATIYQSPALLGVPDGIYRLSLKTTPKPAPDQPLEGTPRPTEIFFPQYFIWENGKGSFSATYPGLTPRAFRWGENLAFDILTPAPQVQASQGCRWDNQHLILPPGESLLLRLPTDQPRSVMHFNIALQTIISKPSDLIVKANGIPVATLHCPEDAQTHAYDVELPPEARDGEGQSAWTFAYAPGSPATRDPQRSQVIHLVAITLLAP